jgi:hypothetical protein
VVWCLLPPPPPARRQRQVSAALDILSRLANCQNTVALHALVRCLEPKACRRPRHVMLVVTEVLPMVRVPWCACTSSDV